MDINTSKISFCNDEGDNINDTEVKKQILDILETKYGITLKYNHALILKDKSLKYLKNPHYISVKTTGTNYFLFLTKFNNINCCFYIDRKIKQGYTCPRIISVKYRFDDSIFEDTLLDGEIVKDKNNNWMFLTSDIIVGEGKHLLQNNKINERFSYLYSLIKDKYVKDQQTEICPIFIKKLFKYSEYNNLITSFIPKLTYGIRGLYFNSVNPKHKNHLFLYPKNKEEILVKNKKNTNINKGVFKTFQLRKTIQPGIYDLYCLNDDKIVKFDTARIPGLTVSRLVTKLFDSQDEVYVNCKFNESFNKWEPQKESSKKNMVDIKNL